MAELTGSAVLGAAGRGPVPGKAGGEPVRGKAGRSADRTRRSLATILAGQPAPAVHASGGRDQWSAPLREAPADKEGALKAALGEVLDPELPISLLELGLVYGVGFDGGTARVDLTFTATACPCMDFIKQDVRDRIGMEPWVDTVEINEVWDPPWTTARMTEEGRRKLGRFGVGA